MKLADPPLPPNIWAATPRAAQALILTLQERIRELQERAQGTALAPAVPRAAEKYYVWPPYRSMQFRPCLATWTFSVIPRAERDLPWFKKTAI